MTISTYTELEKWLNAKDLKGLTWKSEWLDNVNHSSMLGQSLYNGLLFLFDGWKIPFDVILSGDISAIEAHGAAVKAKFGDRLVYDIPENLLNQVGYQLMSRKTYDRAMDLFKLNVKLHPIPPIRTTAWPRLISRRAIKSTPRNTTSWPSRKTRAGRTPKSAFSRIPGTSSKSSSSKLKGIASAGGSEMRSLSLSSGQS